MKLTTFLVYKMQSLLLQNLEYYEVLANTAEFFLHNLDFIRIYFC